MWTYTETNSQEQGILIHFQVFYICHHYFYYHSTSSTLSVTNLFVTRQKQIDCNNKKWNKLNSDMSHSGNPVDTLF